MSNIEAFVDADKAATFLSLTRRRVLELARAGCIPAHPIGTGKRKTWRFRLSEIAEATSTVERPLTPTLKEVSSMRQSRGNRIGGTR